MGETEQSWSGTLSPLPRRRRLPSSSLMNWMLLVRRDLTQKRLETERCREQCWSFSISWMVSLQMMTLRLLLLQTELIFLTPLYSDLEDWTEKSRARIMQIHARKMNVDPDVNYEELARSTDDFNGAQCKAVCVEAGMIALRRESSLVTHEDFLDAVIEVQAKKKANLNYYA